MQMQIGMKEAALGLIGKLSYEPQRKTHATSAICDLILLRLTQQTNEREHCVYGRYRVRCEPKNGHDKQRAQSCRVVSKHGALTNSESESESRGAL